MAITVPNTFADKSGQVQLEDLDDNFSQLATGVNQLETDINNDISVLETTIDNIEDPVAMSLLFGPDPQVDASSSAEAQALSSNTTFITPLGLNSALQGSNQSLTTNGYQKLPGGLIIQWGLHTTTQQGDGSVATLDTNFPIAFPTACLAMNATSTSGSSIDGDTTVTFSATQFGIKRRNNSGLTLSWIALGY